MVSNIDGVKVKQILWNPVIANTVALCLSDGALGAYVIKANSFEYNSLDRSESARYVFHIYSLRISIINSFWQL